MANDSARPDVAVFIDFENVYVSVRDKLDANPNFESIMDRCEDLGRVVIARAYADWYRYPRITSALYANSIEPMYVPTYYYDRDLGRTGRAIKNSVDMNLCVDAMKTLFTNPNIAKFVLATGDRDFIPLVNTIRQQGKEVIVIGIGGAASAHLAQSADEFIFYETLVGKPATPAAAAAPAKEQSRPRTTEKARDPYEDEPERETRPREREAVPAERDTSNGVYDTLVQAIHLARERGYVCSFGSLKLLMKELMNGEFKEGKYKDGNGRPFAKFKDFVLEAERRGKVQVFTNGTVNEVFLPGEDPYKLSQFAAELKEEPAAVAPIYTPEPAEERPAESRATISGRRRRRRPRNQRATGSDAVSRNGKDDEGEEYTEPETFAPADLAASEEADAMFESLLDRIEQEKFAAQQGMDEPQAETDSTPELSVVDAPVEAILEPETVPAETDEQPAAPAPDLAPPVLEQRPFIEREWELLREVLAASERPMSFAQIHDALRNARNQATLERTNEELRTLIKQAINGNMLERTGKGSRIAYRLKADEATEQVSDDAAETTTMPVAETTGPVDEGLLEHAAETAEETSAGTIETPAMVDTGLVEQATEAAEEVSAGTIETPAMVDTGLVEQAADAASETSAATVDVPDAVVAEEPAKPKRRTRRKKTDTPPEPVVEAAPQADASETLTEQTIRTAEELATTPPASEEPAKPKRRTRRKKAEPATEAPDEA